MTTDSIINDPELGQIRVCTDGRAHRISFLAKAGAIYARLPYGTTRSDLARAIEQLRPRLLEMRSRIPVVRFSLDYRIDTEFFHLRFEQGSLPHFASRTEGDSVRILCPPGTDFTDGVLQEWLHSVVVEALRKQAESVLPGRLRRLAQQHDLPFRLVKVNASTGRWGSCSMRKDINLSCFLMLLPARLIDYVLLHELAHTREMNHGKGFRALLDQLTGGQSKALLKELGNYRTDQFFHIGKP